MERGKAKKKVLVTMLVVLMIALGFLFVGCKGSNPPSDPSTQNNVTLTINTNNSAYGSIQGAGTYKKGTTVTITVVPNEGYYLDKWSDIDLLPRLQTSIKLDKDTTLTAYFEEGQAVEYGNSIIRCKAKGGVIKKKGDFYDLYVADSRNPAVEDEYVSHWTDDNGDIVRVNFIHSIYINSIKTNRVYTYKANYGGMGGFLVIDKINGDLDNNRLFYTDEKLSYSDFRTKLNNQSIYAGGVISPQSNVCDHNSIETKGLTINSQVIAGDHYTMSFDVSLGSYEIVVVYFIDVIKDEKLGMIAYCSKLTPAKLYGEILLNCTFHGYLVENSGYTHITINASIKK